MPRVQVEAAKVLKAVQSITEYKRLIQMIRTMALELERQSEENKQLRAAIEVYREVVRRSAVNNANGADCPSKAFEVSPLF